MSLKQPNTQRAPQATPMPAAEAAEQALVQHKLVLETLLESTADFIYMKDREGRYVFANPAAAQSVGKSPQEIIGKDDRALFPEEHARHIMEKDRQIMASGISEVFEETRGYAGGVRHLHSSKNVCRDSSGAVIGIVGISRDITELKRAEEALNSSELNAAGARMANALAHEINNPLAALTNALFLLRQRNGSVPADDLLGAAQESLWRITKITRQMIGLYNRTAAARHIQVQDVVKDTLANLDSRIKKKGIRCESRSLSMRVLWDRCGLAPADYRAHGERGRTEPQPGPDKTLQPDFRQRRLTVRVPSHHCRRWPRHCA